MIVTSPAERDTDTSRQDVLEALAGAHELVHNIQCDLRDQPPKSHELWALNPWDQTNILRARSLSHRHTKALWALKQEKEHISTFDPTLGQVFATSGVKRYHVGKLVLDEAESEFVEDPGSFSD